MPFVGIGAIEDLAVFGIDDDGGIFGLGWAGEN